MKPKQTFTLPGDEFAHTINSVVFAAAREQVRDKALRRANIDLQNVCFEIQLDAFRCIATDVKRMSIAKTLCTSNVGSGYSVTMYRINAKDMARQYQNSEEVVGHIHKNLLDTDNPTTYMNLEDESDKLAMKSAFPLQNNSYLNWRKTVPYAKKPLMVILDTKQFLKLIRDMFKGVTRKMIPVDKRCIRLEIGSGRIIVRPGEMLATEAASHIPVFDDDPYPEALDHLKNNVKHEIEVETPDDDYVIRINAAYLVDALQAVRDDKFVFAHGDKSEFVIANNGEKQVLTPVSIFNVHYQLAPLYSPYFHMIMPMKPQLERTY